VTCIIRVDKSFTYRGSPERFSNKYHLSGSNPASSAEWKAITDALFAAEKPIYPSGTTIIYASGYTSDTGAAVYTRDMTVLPDTVVPGTLVTTGGIPQAGDDSVWARWWAGQYDSRGKKIYLRKYWHPAYSSSGGGDSVFGQQKTNMQTFAALLISGLTVTGYSTRYLCDKAGNLATAYNVVSYITTRTLKRRSGSPL
jgi:hypothetical protein